MSKTRKKYIKDSPKIRLVGANKSKLDKHRNLIYDMGSSSISEDDYTTKTYRYIPQKGD